MKIKNIKIFTDDEKTDSIFITTIKTENDLILVDAGYPMMLEIIDDKLKEINLSLEEVTEIWITHHDHDHIGSLNSIKNKYPHIKVKSSKEEAENIQGERTSLRLEQAILQQGILPPEQKQEGKNFQEYLRAINPCKVDEILEDRDNLLDRQVLVVKTPGHTKGHISFYIPKYKTLIAGDLLVVEKDKLMIPHPRFAFNLEDTKESIRKVAKLQIEKIICYHGGEVVDKPEVMEKRLLKVVDETKLR